MLQILQELGAWSWLILGTLLIILEIVAPGAVFMWLGIAAGLVGVIVFILPDLDWRWQFALFAVLSVASIFISRKYLKRKPIATDQPTLNRRAQQYIGREAILEQAITSGTGRIALGDGTWRVRGPDLPIGTRVKVVDSAGGRLVVEAMTSLDGDTGPSAEDPSGEA